MKAMRMHRCIMMKHIDDCKAAANSNIDITTLMVFCRLGITDSIFPLFEIDW